MIKQIIFKSTKTLVPTLITVDLSEGVNVIIGPKGGGKSTLFDLIAGLKNNYISDNVVKALETYNLKFEKAIKFSNEEILLSQLSKKSKKAKEEDYRDRNDVIYQDDQIKKDLTSLKEIERNKFEYIKKQVAISDNVSNLILEIKNLYYSMNKLWDYFKNEIVNINWTNTFKMNELKNEDKLNIITKLDYKENQIANLIDDEIRECKNLSLSIEEFNNKLNRIKSVEKDNIIKDDKFNETLLKNIDTSLKSNAQINLLINDRLKLLLKIKDLTKLFANSYRKVIDNIKKVNFASSGLKSYEIQAKNHFKNLATDVFKAINNFEKLSSNEVILNIENVVNEEDNLFFNIPNNLKLKEESLVKILGIVFYSPGSYLSDVSKWLKTMTEKGVKEFDEDKLINCISRVIEDEVKVLVNFGDEKRDYESLSLGQKSIYGLKYKFNKSINDNLYLDQPEDNLDNNTIASEILPMIKQKDNQQVIIVTHNANIGILSNPKKIIVADLNNEKEPYKVAEIGQIMKDQSALYLEGGTEYLNQRFNKIIGNGEK